mmetsp:Transcript_94395/g.243779  ORF Transcript_94395/g.243779 Transcript_94395/m.243779 type:complete len:232 (+) Transcript_94395:973-1668(+)
MRVHVCFCPSAFCREPELRRSVEVRLVASIHEFGQSHVLLHLLQHGPFPGWRGVRVIVLNILDAPVEWRHLWRFLILRPTAGPRIQPTTLEANERRPTTTSILLIHLGAAEDRVRAEVITVPLLHGPVLPKILHDEDAAIQDLPLEDLLCEIRHPEAQSLTSPIRRVVRLRVAVRIQRRKSSSCAQVQRGICREQEDDPGGRHAPSLCHRHGPADQAHHKSPRHQSPFMRT